MGAKKGIQRRGLSCSANRADRISAAGVNLIMPGSKKDVRRILKALQQGRLSREQLVRNASGVIRLIRETEEASVPKPDDIG